MPFARIVIISLFAGLPLPSAALAEEQVLQLKLVTTTTSDAEMELASITDQSVTASEAVGVAYFDDGRVAFKRYAIASVGGESDGAFMGLSTYTFENGDTLNVKFDGIWSPDEEKLEYTVLSGTGGFEGATGTGELTGLSTPWEDAHLLEGSFTLQVGEN